jgi:hypothetical protein
VNSILRVPRAVALGAVALLVAAASLVSFGESYRGLYLWAREHGLAGAWAVIWPLQVDVFIAVGELALFVAILDHWQARSRSAAWTVTGIGLAVSVAGNVGHVAGHSAATRVTAAIPPIAAAAALAVGLGVLKRIMENHPAPPAQTAQGVPLDSLDAAIQAMLATAEAGNPLSGRQLEARFGLKRMPATRVRELVLASMNGSAPDAPE